jgi:hypothetical protein
MRYKKAMFPLLAVICLFGATSCKNRTGISDNVTEIIAPDAPANFFDKPGEYLDWQSASMLNIVRQILLEYPPRVIEPQERQVAMVMLDAVFHDEGAPHRRSVQIFHHQQTSSVLKELENTEASKGMMIWKLYDMGVIIRTKSVTVAFDITRGYSSNSEAFALPDEMMDKLTDQCDLLFISHSHRDHADEVVAQMFLDKSKPVVAPPDVWEGKEIYDRITHLERKAHEVQQIWLENKDLELDVVVYPGHQGTNLLNNVVLVFTPDGYNVCHTGDQSNEDDFSWIDEVAEHHTVDVLVPNCWTPDPLRTATGYAPLFIIPAHENELGHSIDHRESYALNYSRWDVPYFKIIMTWGESFHFNPI